MKDRTQAAISKPHEQDRWLLFGSPPTQKSLHCSLNALSANTIAVIIINIPARMKSIGVQQMRNLSQQSSFRWQQMNRQMIQMRRKRTRRRPNACNSRPITDNTWHATNHDGFSQSRMLLQLSELMQWHPSYSRCGVSCGWMYLLKQAVHNPMFRKSL